MSEPHQVYISLWSHAERRPGHIHYVVQPVDQQTIARHDAHGPKLQAAMFNANEAPDSALIEEYAARARTAWHHS